ncbi:hypothetical protein HY948_01670 [Candidatus Gottesmanbacteria bacterium]|nr:hypothetical protein [Candidatus Gottesmanbacteria bacterium]
MCCTEIVKKLDKIALSGGEQAQLARGGVFRLVTTCFRADQTVTEGLKADLKEQKKKEGETGTHLHGEALQYLLDHKEETIVTRQAGLAVARQLLDETEFQEAFQTIQNQCE